MPLGGRREASSGGGGNGGGLTDQQVRTLVAQQISQRVADAAKVGNAALWPAAKLPVASSRARGVIQLATNAQAAAGVGDRAMVPANIGSIGVSRLRGFPAAYDSGKFLKSGASAAAWAAISWTDLSDTAAALGSGGQYLRLNAGGTQIGFGNLPDASETVKGLAQLASAAEVKASAAAQKVVTAAGVTSIELTSLSGMPDSYTGQSAKVLAVKSSEDGMEFVEQATGGGGSGTVPAPAKFSPASDVSMASATTGAWNAETTLMETDSQTRLRKLLVVATVRGDNTTLVLGGGSRLYLQAKLLKVTAAGVESDITDWVDHYLRNVDTLAGDNTFQIVENVDLPASDKVRVKVRTRQQARTAGGPSAAVTVEFAAAENQLAIRELVGQKGDKGDKGDPGGATTLVGLTDTPAALGAGNQYLRMSGANPPAVQWGDLPDATELAKGIVQLATNAQATAAASGVAALTPKNIGSIGVEKLDHFPAAFSDGKFLKSTAGAAEWADIPAGGGKLKGVGILPATAGYSRGDVWGVPHDALFELTLPAQSSASVTLNGYSPTVQTRGDDSDYGWNRQVGTTNPFGARPAGVPTAARALFMDDGYSYWLYADAGTFGRDGALLQHGAVKIKLTFLQTTDGVDQFLSQPAGAADQWSGAALDATWSLHSLSTKPFSSLVNRWSRMLTQGALDPAQAYGEFKTIPEAGQGIKITADDSRQKLTFSAAIGSGPQLPANPKVGDEWRLTADQSVAHNFVTLPNVGISHPQLQTSIFTLRGIASGFPTRVVFFSSAYSGVDSATLRNSVFVEAASVAAGTKLVFGEQGQVPREYDIDTAHIAGDTSRFRVRGINGDAVSGNGQRYTLNVKKGSVKGYPDQTVKSGDLTFAGEDHGTAGWIPTPGVYQVLPRVPYANVRLMDGLGIGLTVTSGSADKLGVLQLFNPLDLSDTVFDLAGADGGDILVEVVFRLATRSSNTIVMDAASSGLTEKRLLGICTISSLKAAASGTGVEVLTMDFYNAAVRDGTVSFYIDKNSNDEVGYRLSYDGNAGSGDNWSFHVGITALWQHNDGPRLLASTNLTDTPANMVGQAGKIWKVNATASAWEWASLPAAAPQPRTLVDFNVPSGADVDYGQLYELPATQAFALTPADDERQLAISLTTTNTNGSVRTPKSQELMMRAGDFRTAASNTDIIVASVGLANTDSHIWHCVVSKGPNGRMRFGNPLQNTAKSTYLKYVRVRLI